MDAQNTQIESAPALTLSSSCRKNKDEHTTFVNRVKEFINTPYDEHKACFKSTVHKVTEKLDVFAKDNKNMGKITEKFRVLAKDKKDEDSVNHSTTVKN